MCEAMDAAYDPDTNVLQTVAHRRSPTSAGRAHQVLDHGLRRQVARRAGDRPARVRARATEVEPLDPAEARAGPGGRRTAGPGSISPWKMWPPVMPKRASSSRGPERDAVDDAVREGGADLGEVRDRGVGGRLGVDVGREALAEHATARGGPSGASVGSAAVWHAASIHGRAAGRPARAASAAACSRSSSV